MVAETGVVVMGRKTGDRAQTGRAPHLTVVGGADVVRQFLRAGLVEELRIDVIPVLLGSGLRLFGGDSGAYPVQLEKSEVQEVGERTSLRFRVQR